MAAVLNQLGMEAARLDARAFLRAERAAQPQVDEGIIPSAAAAADGAASQQTSGGDRLYPPATRPVKPSCWAVTGLTTPPPRIGCAGGRFPRHYLERRRRCTARIRAKVKDACLLPLLRLDEASELARLAALGAPCPHAYSRFPPAISICSYAVAIRRNRVPRALSAYWPPVLAPDCHQP